MKPSARVANIEAAEEIGRWLEHQSKRVTIEKVGGIYNVYADEPAPVQQKPQKRKAVKPAKKKPGRIGNVWAYVIISTIIALLLLKFL